MKCIDKTWSQFVKEDTECLINIMKNSNKSLRNEGLKVTLNVKGNEISIKNSFRKFFNDCTFKLLAVGDSNWDYYSMQYQLEPLQVVALAKVEGCNDCCFGSVDYFKRFQKTNSKLILTDEGKELIGLKKECTVS